MMLAVIRGIVRYDSDIHAGNWHYSTPGVIPRAQDMTVGILGLGRIGKRFAHYAQPIFKRIIAHDPNLIEGDFPQYVHKVGIDELFETADAISLHCLLNEGTRGLVGERLLSGMKKGAYLVNTARGDVVDEPALVAALAEGRIAGAGLDVFADEPHVPAELLALPSVTLLPHIGSATLETRTAMGMLAAENLIAHFAGEPLPSRVV